MIDRDAACHRQTGLFGPPDHVQRERVGHSHGVIARAGQLHKADVPFKHDGFRLPGNTGQTQTAGPFPLPHHAITAQTLILGKMQNQRVKITGIGHGAAHNARPLYALFAIGKGKGAGLLQQADFRNFLSGEPFGQCRRRINPHIGFFSRAAAQIIHNRRIINTRLGIGHGEERSDAAEHRRAADRGQCLPIFPARLADKGLHINKPGTEQIAFTINDLSALRHRIITDMRAKIGNPPPTQHHAATAAIAKMAIDQRNHASPPMRGARS